MALLTNGKGDVLELSLDGDDVWVIFHDHDGYSGEAQFSRKSAGSFITNLIDEYEDTGDDEAA